LVKLLTYSKSPKWLSKEIVTDSIQSLSSQQYIFMESKMKNIAGLLVFIYFTGSFLSPAFRKSYAPHIIIIIAIVIYFVGLNYYSKKSKNQAG
jgi:hypothetical protein